MPDQVEDNAVRAVLCLPLPLLPRDRHATTRFEQGTSRSPSRERDTKAPVFDPKSATRRNLVGRAVSRTTQLDDRVIPNLNRVDR